MKKSQSYRLSAALWVAAIGTIGTALGEDNIAAARPDLPPARSSEILGDRFPGAAPIAQRATDLLKFAATPAKAESVVPETGNGAASITETIPSNELKSEQQVEEATPRVKITMSGVERIRLRVWGSPELSGEYSVDPDFTLSIPGIGRLAVGGLTPATLEDLLSERLSASTRRETRVSVEVARSRPFFIMGQIGQPGAIEWRAGLNVIQATALGGGIMRSTAAAETSAGNTSLRLDALVAQLALLKAEKVNSNSVAQGIEAALSLPSNSFSMQATPLDEQRLAFRNKLIGLESQRQSADRELVTTRQQLTSITTVAESTRNTAGDIETLRQKKLVANKVYLAHRAELLGIERQLADARLQVERAASKAETLAHQISVAKQEYQASLTDRIDSLTKEVDMLRGSAADGKNPGLNSGSGAMEYYIARSTNGNVQTIPATIFTEVWPGDVVIVTLSNARTVASAPKPTQHAATASHLELAQRVLEASAQTKTAVQLMPERSGQMAVVPR